MRTTYPIHGDVRTRTFLALFPVEAFGYRWWLERVTVREQYASYPESWLAISVNGITERRTTTEETP